MAFLAGQKLRAADLGQLASSAQYSGAANQTIATVSDVVVAFGSADYTTSLVTRAASGAGHSFTLNASGLWAVSVSVRWSVTGVSAAGEKHIHVMNALGLWHHSSTIGAETDAPVTNHVSFIKPLEATDTIRVVAYQSSGGDEDLEYNVGFGVPRINLSLVLGS